MFKRKILILTKSKKRGNYCVAGIDTTYGQWVRIVSDDESIQGAITDKDMTCSDGTLCDVLDVVEVSFSESRATIIQPENILMDRNGPWVKVDHWTMDEALAFYRKNPCYLLYSDDKYIFRDRFSGRKAEYIKDRFEKKEEYDRSLALVQVSDLRFIHEVNSSGYRKSKVEFEYNGIQYTSISMTDPNFYNTEDGTEYEKAYIVMSLGEPFNNNGYCYKFAAKIFLPDD